MDHKINKSVWHTCKICNKTIKDLAKIYGGSGVYYSKVFISHLKIDHDIFPEEYFEKYDNRPICCTKCNKKCNIHKKQIKWKRMCGISDGLLKWSNKAKIERSGSGNPMYNKKPWNKDLSKENPIIKRIAENRKGIKFTEEHKKKLSVSAIKSAKKYPNRGMGNKKHSELTCEKLRQSTLNLIKNGAFKQTKTKPHIIMCELLTSMNINFEEEKTIGPYSFDIFLQSFNILIEVDGDYFHSNPKIYPLGPKTKTQKINKYRDIKKDKFCKENGLTLLRFWESDILNQESFIKEKLWQLKKLYQSNQ